MPESYLVIGGSGFLGRHVVERLLNRGEHAVSVFDVVQRHFDVPFYTGDLTVQEDISQAIVKSAATCIIHTASPKHGLKPEIYWKVNRDGTQVVIDACVAHGVKKLVYTSSAGTVYDGSDLIDCDERMPIPTKALDAYNASKHEAESLVIAANGQDGLLTCAIRPALLIGPYDQQLLPPLMKAIRGNKTHFQVGNNDKLFDFTYVTNVAQALVLASDKLTDPPLDPEALNASLSTVYQTRKVPTSEAAPLGPNLSPSAEALASAKAFEKEPEWRPIVRSKFDPLTTKALQLEEGNPLQVAGNVFFITNGQPVYFWDLARTICKELGFPPATKITKVPKSVMMYVAGAMEWWGWITRSEPELTRFRVVYTCCNRWYNIEKARRVLGYYPEVELEEGIKKMGEWYKSEIANGNDPYPAKKA